MTDKIMTISLVFDHKEKGTIIVGINPELDSLSYPEIKSRIGDRILIVNGCQQNIYEVQSIQISTSMANKKNIGISIGEKATKKDIKEGSVVYSLNATANDTKP
ncbi:MULTISPECIES: hypothetical protein [Paenibacillus]|uniref:hypothetical protein n=1 Tax=Paenibacillus TaxID=44249 RepID=UPI0011A53F6A|nr:hypothetical protein [Paenibacillus sp. IHBB 10380]